MVWKVVKSAQPPVRYRPNSDRRPDIVSLPDSRSRGRRSSLESAPIYITPRKKLREKQCGAVRLPVSPPFRTTPRAQNASSASRTACYCRLDAPRGPEEAAIRVRREGV